MQKRLLLLAALLGTLLLPGAESAVLKLCGPDSGLIGPAGNRVLKAEFFTSGVRGKVKLRSELHRLYGPNFRADRELELAARPYTAAEFTYTLAEPGLYEWIVTAVDEKGEKIAGAVADCAVLPPVKEGVADLGICTHLTHWPEPERLLDLVKAAGFSRIRDEIAWDGVERERGRFVYPDKFVGLMASAKQKGLRPLLILDYGNGKLYPELFKTSPFPVNDKAREAFVRYACSTVRKFYPTVREFEVWNEPNYVRAEHEYLELLKKVYPEIRKIAPDATVISCGGGGAGGGPGGSYILPILRAGGLEYQDAFSIHPYMAPHDPDRGYGPCRGSAIEYVSVPSVWPYLGKVAEQNKRSNRKPLELWITEIGWPTGNGRSTRSEYEQAAFLARTFLQHRRAGTAKALFWYDLLSDGLRRGEAEHNFGILRADLSPKPAYMSAAVFASQIGNKPFREVLSDDNIKAFCYGSGTGQVTALYALEGNPEYELSLPGRAMARVTEWHGFSEQRKLENGKLRLKLSPAPVYVQAVY